MADTNNVLELLQIADLAKQWPTLKAIEGLALADLAIANDAAAEELQKRADEAAKKQAEADAKAEAERQKLRDEATKAAEEQAKAQAVAKASAPAPAKPVEDTSASPVRRPVMGGDNGS